MAATFVVEDATGLSNANSYVSIEDADAYWENHGNPTTWTTLDTSGKQEALRMGTQYIDLVYEPMYKGRRKEDDQALGFGRYEVYDDRHEAYFDDTVLPTCLVHATIEAAKQFASDTTTGLIPNIDEPGTIKKESVAVGPIKESKEYMGGKSQIKKFRIIDLLMEPILELSSYVERS